MKRRVWIAFLPAVLLIAMVSSFHGAEAKSKSKSKKSNRPAGDTTVVFAKIGDEYVTKAMVDARLAEIPEQFRTSYTTPQGRQQLVDRLIEERLWLHTAEKAGVAQRPDVVDQLERQRRDLLVRTYLNEQLGQAPAVTDSDAQVYYDAHVDEYRTPATATLQHILLKDEAQARRVKALAAKGGDWDKLVQQYSADSLTRTNQGALGTVTEQGNFASLGAQPALAESAIALGDGKIGGPFKTDRGWHVVKVSAVTPAGVRTFDQMKSVILRQLRGDGQQAYYKELLEKARHDMGVQEDTAAIRDFVSQKKSARDLFQDAQALGPPDARIDAYRRVVEAYPDSEVSPQAQFMVGFINSEELKNYDAAEKAFRELLQRYPKSELAESARWMIEHMRTEDAPNFLEAGADSMKSPAARAGSGGSRTP